MGYVYEKRYFLENPRRKSIKQLLKICLAVFFSTTVIALAGCQPQILKAIPADYTIPYGDIVYVENDGRCSQGEVIKITGGHGGRGIPRKYECVKRPE